MNLSDRKFALSIGNVDPTLPLASEKLCPINCHDLNDLLFERLHLATPKQLSFAKDTLELEFLVTVAHRSTQTGNLTILSKEHKVSPNYEAGTSEFCPIHDIATSVHREVVMSWGLGPRKSPTGSPFAYTWDQLCEGSEIVIVGTSIDEEAFTLRIHAVILMRGTFWQTVNEAKPEWEWSFTDDKLNHLNSDPVDLSVEVPLEAYLREVGFVEAVILQPGL